MAWGDGGGWQSGQGPWGSGPRRAPEPPANDLDDFLRRGSESFKNMFSGGGNRFGAILALLAALALWVGSGIYIVDYDEQGVVVRFGEYHRTAPPGLHYRLPWPVEKVYTPSVTSINKVEVGFRAAGSIQRAYDDASLAKESLMLTGDMNIVDVNFDVQWKIDSARTRDFLFNVRDADQTVKPVAESAMREVIGKTPIDVILTEGQSQIAVSTKEIMQQVLDSYGAGIEIVSVNLRKPDVPDAVIDAFQDVKKAEQDRETTVSKAEAYRNDIMPRAQGEAVKLEQEALAYEKSVVAQSQGDVARFLSVYEEYKTAKDVTRKRMYLETMESILAGMEKVLIEDGAKGSGVLPYLPLPALEKKKGAE